ncbi:MAG: rhodanese-like domain-containing protein [Coriobacteriia bacterium]|nr:rhodanese-like domain-containing protein [Coriobacteriia bacterium]
MNRRTILIGVAVAVIGIAALALAMVPRSAVTGALPPSADVSNQQLRDLVSRGARLVDVRTSVEFESGRIEGAENVPVDGLTTAAASWDKAAPVVLYCATGARSLNAFGYLKAQGFSHVYNLTSGIAAWDGEFVSGQASVAAGSLPATGKPTMYDFSTSS